MQTFQEQQGSRTKTKFRFKAGEKRHGFFWWLFIGWWWWMIEFMLWLVCAPFMFIVKLFYHPKKYKGSGKSVSTDEKQNRLCYPVHLSGLRQAVEAYGIIPQGAHNALLFLCRQLKIFDFKGGLC